MAIEAATQAVVPGRLWRAWASNVYPRTGPARDPVGTVFVKGGPRSQGAMAFFTRPGRIKSKDDFYLAIPTAAAGPRGRNRDLTPGEWERAHGVRLRFVYRPGRASLLVLDEGVLSGRKQVARRNSDKRRAAGRGNATIPIFVLIPTVQFANRLSIAPIAQAAEMRLLHDVEQRVRAIA